MSQSPRSRRAGGDRLRLVASFFLGLIACASMAAAGQAQRPPVPPDPDQDEPTPVAAPPGTYAANAVQTCLRQCHNLAPVNLVLQTPHGVKADARTPFAKHACETCHGPSPEHIAVSSNLVGVVYKGLKKSPASARNAMCLTCHASGARNHWSGSQHETRGVACNDCHTIHASDQKVLSKATQAEVCFACHKEQRAQSRRISTHPLSVTGLASTAKMGCSDCHNPHGSIGPTLLVKNSVNETCYTCHAEKRGPFLWDHAPVPENCANCHSPHGSSNAPLLKTRAPYLCQECHSGDHGNQVNSGANLAGGAVTTVNGAQQPGAAAPRAQMGARACLNCHVLIHGSNHPAGAKFQR